MKYLSCADTRYPYRLRNQGSHGERHRSVEFVRLAVVLSCLSCGGEQAPDTVSEGEICAQPAVVEWSESSLRLESPNCASFDLAPRVLGDGQYSISFVSEDGGWQPEITALQDGIFRGLVLEGVHGQWGDSEPVLWKQGYQSWSFSGVVDLPLASLDLEGIPEVGGDGDAAAVAFEKDGTSWWVGAVGKDEGGSLLIGALSAMQTRFYVAFDATNVWAVWGHRGDEISMSAGDVLQLDPVWFGTSANADNLHMQYAEAAARRVGIEPPTGVPPTGWATWYHFFEDITEADVRENLSLAQALPSATGEPPFDVFQIDDGWQKVWGDWTADEGFPSGMDVLAQDIQEAGFTPGLWMAPFYVDRSTDTYIEHPDWWVRDLDGQEITFVNLNTGNYAILDVTHPDAAAWLYDVISAKVDEGWSYLKLDFLYAGAQVGLRHQDVTGIQAFHQGMAIIREAAGDAWILACGAPLLPSLGYAQSFRTGADIAFGFDRIPKLDYLRWAARSTAARAWSNGIWWWIDPDQLLVRPPFTDTEATGSVVANVVSGGVWMLGDDLPALSPERIGLALSAELMGMRGMRGHPRNPLTYVSGIDPGPPFEGIDPNDQVPTIWDFSDGSVALLNVGPDPVEVDGPGGRELLSQTESAPGPRTLAPGAGEIWVR